MVDESCKISSHELSVSKKEEGDHEGGKSSEKWMSSKMRLMRKLIINSDCTTAKIDQKVEDHHHHHQQQQGENINDNNTSNNTCSVPIRVCSDCNTTKTPLWRSGPRGPKVNYVYILIFILLGYVSLRFYRTVFCSENSNNFQERRSSFQKYVLEKQFKKRKQTDN